MLVVRLQRTGRKNDPTYRVVVTEKRAPMKSGELEIVGHYLPAREPAVFSVQQERIEHWISKGARPTDTLARLLKKDGMKDMEKFIEKYTKRRSKKAPPEEPAAPAAAAPAPAQEAPKEEEKKEEAPVEKPTEEPAKEEPAPAAETDDTKKEEA